MFWNELKNFSKNNWWVYLLLAVSLAIVYVTWKWNIIEIIILFLANFLWNLFLMIMQANYTANNNKIWAIYHLSWNFIFTLISIYLLIYFWKYQYIIWQISYCIAAIKAFTFYNFKKDIRFFNEYSLWIFNIFLIIIFVFFWLNWLNIAGKEIFLNLWFESLTMALWFSLVTTGLVSTKDKFRYWANLFWIIFIIIWSGYWVFIWYLWNWIDWVSLWYLILTLTMLVFYLKLLKNYLK